MDISDTRLPQLRRAAEGVPRHIDRIAELSGAEVDVVSVGPDREHTLVRRQSI
jgi:adenylosuccinate synthase